MMTAALLGGGGIAAAIPALPAVGQASPPSSPIVLVKTAPVFDKGIGVSVKSYVACGAGDTGYLSTQVTERSGKGIASGGGYVDFPCTGQVETVTIPTLAGLGSKLFVAGKAYVIATLNDCGPFNCSVSSVSGNVTITVKK